MHVKDILGFSVGPLASAVFGVVYVPLMAWYFSPEDIGRINLAQVILSFSLLFLVLGLDQAYVREYHVVENKKELLNSCFTPGFLFLIVLALPSVLFSESLAYYIFGINDPTLYALLLVCVCANYISKFLSLILRMQGRGLAFSMSQVVPKALQLALLGVVIGFGIQRNFLSLLFVTFISSLAVMIVYAWNTRSQWQGVLFNSLKYDEVKSLLNYGLPLIFSGLAYWGLTATSTLILRNYSNLAELGVYGVTSSFTAAAAIFQSIFTVVWAPTVYKWVASGVDMARVDAITRQALAAVCGIFVMIGGFSWVIDYLLPPYYEIVKYLVVAAIIPTLLYSMSEITCIGIGITRRTGLTIWITLAALVTNILMAMWLVPTFGAAGAVISNAISYVVFFVFRTEVSAKVWRGFPRVRLYALLFFFVTLAIIYVIYGQSMYWVGPNIWLWLLPAYYLIFRNEIASVFNYLKVK